MANISYPAALTNGTTADATAVMAFFNAITAQVNGNIEALNMANDTITAAKIAPDAVGSSELANNAVDAAALAPGAASLVFRTVHTFAVQGAISVPSGSADYIPPFFVPKAANQTVKLIACRAVIQSGTSVTAKLQRNLADATGFTGVSVTTTAATTDPADITLADGDVLALVVTAISGAPQNLSFSLYFEHTVTN